MSISVLAISFDAHNAAELVQFWAAQTLHRSVNDDATEADRLTSLGAQQTTTPTCPYTAIKSHLSISGRVVAGRRAANLLRPSNTAKL